MKELKIFSILVFFSLLVYWGVEPYALSKMEQHVAPANFKFDDLKPINYKGDPKIGKSLIVNTGCTGCHSIKAAKITASMSKDTAIAAFGVAPPDLSDAGYLYNAKFLKHFILNPAHTFLTEKKFGPTHPFPMPSYYGTGGNKKQEVSDIVAYLQSIAPKKLTGKEVFISSCERCHSMKYDKLTQLGKLPNFKTKTAKLAFELKLSQYQDHLKKYLATTPPDLSIIIRAKSHKYLVNFIDDPQKLIKNTSMPRVGLKKENVEKVIKYFESIGDRKKAQRETLIPKIIGFLIILTLFAYLWKSKLWKDL